MKIAYFGLPLGALLLASDGAELALVTLAPVAAPGRPRLRRMLTDVPLIDCLRGGAAPLIEERLQQLRPDVLLSWFWTRKLPAEWLAVPGAGAFGVHPSLLPRHRGPDPYFAAIDAGDEHSGATLHRLAEGYDTGDIVQRESVPVGEMNAWQLARAIDRSSLRLLRSAAARLRAGEALVGRPQDEQSATWAGEPEGDQLRVQWSWPTHRVLRRIRALAPVPGLALSILGLDFLLLQARPAPPAALALSPGEAAIDEGVVSIRTGDGAISLEAAQLAGSEHVMGRSKLAALLKKRRSSGGG